MTTTTTLVWHSVQRTQGVEVRSQHDGWSVVWDPSAGWRLYRGPTMTLCGPLHHSLEDAVRAAQEMTDHDHRRAVERAHTAR